MVEKGL